MPVRAQIKLTLSTNDYDSVGNERTFLNDRAQLLLKEYALMGTALNP